MNTIATSPAGFSPSIEPLVQSGSFTMHAAAQGARPSSSQDSIKLSLSSPDESTSKLMADALNTMTQGNADPLSAHNGLSAERVMRLVGLLD